MNNEIVNKLLWAEALNEMEYLRKDLKQLRKEKDHLRRIVNMAFTQAGNTCITGCRAACMCTCGYEHYAYIVREEEKQN